MGVPQIPGSGTHPPSAAAVEPPLDPAVLGGEGAEGVGGGDRERLRERGGE